MKPLHQMLKDGEWKPLTRKEVQKLKLNCKINTSEFKRIRQPPKHKTIRNS